MVIVTVIGLVVGGVVYLLSFLRGSRVSLLEAIFSWPVVVVGLLTLLQYIQLLFGMPLPYGYSKADRTGALPTSQ